MSLDDVGRQILMINEMSIEYDEYKVKCQDTVSLTVSKDNANHYTPNNSLAFQYLAIFHLF